MALLLTSLLLLAFALLAVIDGFYLHLFKYELFKHTESKLEHLTHTIRAILFPLIVYFLFVKQTSISSFYLGSFFVVIDIIVLGIDAYVEKDSRVFMGGLPRWEYILHLFVNAFHFASIAVFLSIKLNFSDEGIYIISDLSSSKYYSVFHMICINLIPGALLIAIVHVLTSITRTQRYWLLMRSRITCC